MSNFFLDNSDLLFHFDRLDLRDVIEIIEHGYSQAEVHDDAPRNHDEAIDYYHSALELFGKLCSERIAPRAQAVDLAGTTLTDGKVEYAAETLENIKDLADAGFMGVIIPRRFGGIGFPASIYMMMIEMLSRADASLMTTFGYQDVGEAIAKYGTLEQAEEFLPDYARGKKIGAMVMTEPGAGSDLQAIRLKAYQDESGQWYLNGVKQFISNGNGGLLLVVARSEGGSRDLFGLSLFACHGGERVRVTTVEHKMGLHGSPTCELYFDDAPAQLIGKRRSGMTYVLNILNHARFSVASQALGIAEGAYKEALAFARERQQFGTIIYDMPPVSDMLISMRSTLDWMRSMVYAGSQWLDLRNALEERISELKRDGKPFKDEKVRFDRASRILNLLSPLTKYVVTEAAVRICYDAQQLHGGLGYMREMAVERMVRDVRITTIYEGTSQVQVVSCSNSVKADILKNLFDEMASRDYGEQLIPFRDKLETIREIFDQCRACVRDSDDKLFQAAAMKELVDIYSSIWTGYLLIGEAAASQRKLLVAQRYVKDALARAKAARCRLEEKIYSDLEYRDIICD